MFQFLVGGKNGEIESIEEIEDRKTLAGKVGINLRVRPGDNCSKLIIERADPRSSSEENNLVRAAVTTFYKEWGMFDPYNGEIITIERRVVSVARRIMFNYVVTSIGSREYNLPKMTADIVPFVNDQISGGGKTFFIGIIRKFNPGAGKPAFIGGFRELHGSHFQTPLEALEMESFQEARLKVKMNDCGSGLYKLKPEMQHEEIRLGIGELDIGCVLTRVGSYLPEPGKEEHIEHLDEMRVNETSAYTCFAETDIKLSEGILKEMLVPGDDAGKIFVWDTSRGIPAFGLSHHREIYLDALEMHRNMAV